MHTDHNLRVVARTAELTAADDDTDDEDAWRFGGVAVGEGDILHTDDGTPVVFTEDVLAEAAHTQAGEPLSKNHPEDDQGNPVYPPPVEETAGTVEKAGYVPGKGLVYEARTHDETIAEGVKAGSFDVSVHPTFDLGEEDPETGAFIPENVEFLDLATVSKGMSASNTAEWGPNQALASWTRDADIAAEIEAHADDPAEDDREGLIASTVRATLQAVGVSRDEVAAEDVPLDQDPDDEQPSDERPDSRNADPADDPPDEPMTDEPTEDDPDEQPDTEPEADPGEDPGPEETETDDNTVTVDLGDHASLEDLIDTRVQEATANASREDKVDEVIANSDEYADEDREELMAASDSLFEKIHSQATRATGARLPGSAGARSSVTASAGTDEDDLDEFGTGVQE